MPRLLLCLLALIGVLATNARAQNPPLSLQVSCGSTATYSASTNGKTKIVTGISGRAAHICRYVVVWGGTATVSLGTGTGTDCGTTYTAITPAYSGAATSPAFVDGADYFQGLQTVSGEDLCVNTSAGVAIQVMVYYTVW